MKLDILTIPEHQRRIILRCNGLMEALNYEYKHSKPEHGEHGFKDRVHGRIKTFFKDDASPDLTEGGVYVDKITELLVGDGQPIESDVLWIYHCCAHSMAALWKLNKGDQEHAWDLLCSAHILLGVIRNTHRGHKIFVETAVKFDRSAQATKRGSLRHRETNDLKRRAYEIVRAEAPWNSQASAVSVVQNKLIDEAGEDCLKNFEATITGWIKLMPDRLDLIPSLANRLTRK